MPAGIAFLLLLAILHPDHGTVAPRPPAAPAPRTDASKPSPEPAPEPPRATGYAIDCGDRHVALSANGLEQSVSFDGERFRVGDAAGSAWAEADCTTGCLEVHGPAQCEIGAALRDDVKPDGLSGGKPYRALRANAKRPTASLEIRIGKATFVLASPGDSDTCRVDVDPGTRVVRGAECTDTDGEGGSSRTTVVLDAAGCERNCCDASCVSF